MPPGPVSCDVGGTCAAVLLLLRGRGWLRGLIDGERERRELHLLPRLLAPVHVHRRIWVRLAGGRVVVPGGRPDLGALRQLQRLLEYVVGLPVEIVLGNREHDLGAPIRVGRLNLPPAPADVRVRHETPDRHVRLSSPRLPWWPVRLPVA